MLAALLAAMCSRSFAQSSPDSVLNKIDPAKFSASVAKKADKIQDKIILRSDKALSRLQRQEEKLYNKMLKGKDSLQAKAALQDMAAKYKSLQDKIKNPSLPGKAGKYIPALDTLITTLKFLNTGETADKIKDALAKTESLSQKFKQAEEIKKFISQRKQQLKAQLENLGMARQLKKLNKQVYYYSEQLNEYKAMLKDHSKAERKAIELLSKTKLYKDFMRNNSQLALLFRLPGSGSDPLAQAGLAGLQTRAQVNNIIQQQIAAGGPNAMAQVQQNLQQAQSQLSQLKNKILQAGKGSSDAEMPEGFRPNTQKTKSFWDRLEYGTNIQSQKPNGYFPVTSDIGLSVGYKLNDKSIIGIGASYKLGWGQNIRHIQLSSQGAGLRSFIDWKIKGSFWVSGGYEANYCTEFNRIEALKDMNAWRQSCLIGVSKTVSPKTKFFKKTKLMLLWDFLSYQQVPRTQPVVFRIGYSF